MPGSYIIKPIEAKLNDNCNFNKEMKPFCSFIFGGKQFATKPANFKGDIPTWDSPITILSDADTSSNLRLDIKDKDESKDALGNCQINLKEIENQGRFRQWYPLRCNNKDVGEILLDSIFEEDFSDKNKEERLDKDKSQLSDKNMSDLPDRDRGEFSDKNKEERLDKDKGQQLSDKNWSDPSGRDRGDFSDKNKEERLDEDKGQQLSDKNWSDPSGKDRGEFSDKNKEERFEEDSQQLSDKNMSGLSDRDRGESFDKNKEERFDEDKGQQLSDKNWSDPSARDRDQLPDENKEERLDRDKGQLSDKNMSDLSGRDREEFSNKNKEERFDEDKGQLLSDKNWSDPSGRDRGEFSDKNKEERFDEGKGQLFNKNRSDPSGGDRGEFSDKNKEERFDEDKGQLFNKNRSDPSGGDRGEFSDKNKEERLDRDKDQLSDKNMSGLSDRDREEFSDKNKGGRFDKDKGDISDKDKYYKKSENIDFNKQPISQADISERSRATEAKDWNQIKEGNDVIEGMMTEKLGQPFRMSDKQREMYNNFVPQGMNENMEQPQWNKRSEVDDTIADKGRFTASEENSDRKIGGFGDNIGTNRDPIANKDLSANPIDDSEGKKPAQRTSNKNELNNQGGGKAEAQGGLEKTDVYSEGQSHIGSKMSLGLIERQNQPQKTASGQNASAEGLNKNASPSKEKKIKKGKLSDLNKNDENLTGVSQDQAKPKELGKDKKYWDSKIQGLSVAEDEERDRRLGKQGFSADDKSLWTKDENKDLENRQDVGNRSEISGGMQSNPLGGDLKGNQGSQHVTQK